MKFGALVLGVSISAAAAVGAVFVLLLGTASAPDHLSHGRCYAIVVQPTELACQDGHGWLMPGWQDLGPLTQAGQAPMR